MRAHTLQAPDVRTPVVALLTALVGGLLVVALTPGPAEAVVRTSTGKACTIVGTQGRDVLRGTARRDVVCGRGGNDVIDGRGGDDVIDGGAGHDRLTGSAGHDQLLGGAGSDRLSGSAGNDRLVGGAGHDRISGAAGDDRADGGAGDDVVSGGTGDDDVNGGAGGDRVAGGPGADDGDGGPGSDVVLGEAGDDQLGGGSGRDTVDGGPGFNLCDTPSDTADRQVRCAIDTEAPVLRSLTLSRTSVDVSHGAQTVTATAHVTDDTGVRSVTFDGGWGRRVSGTARDGIWKAEITVPANRRPGEQEVAARLQDRVGHPGATAPSRSFTVVNTVLDRESPVVRSLTLDRTTVDARTEQQFIWVTVRITDDLTGPTDDVLVCLSHASATGSPVFRRVGDCSQLSKVSGTVRDSTWRGAILIPEGADDGTWNTDLRVGDASGTHGSTTWWGPDSLAAQPAGSTLRALPGGAGAFRVVGTAVDTRAPRLTSVRMSPSTVDTTHGAKVVTVEVAGTDAEGITGVAFLVGGYSDRAGPDDWLQIASIFSFDLVRGTRTNGVWRKTFVVPGGTPNGTYPIEARLQDKTHLESWTADGNGWGSAHTLDATTAPTGANLVVANSP
ncbi:MAG: calcium-binding protein [Nocardioidaceae bacterium]|nr:calcium-binding protein [Nocardioidaceae bacterium]